MILTYSKHYFYCSCDKCGRNATVEENKDYGIYNAAQAVRSLGWSFGKDKQVYCSSCRKSRLCDKHKK